MKRNIVVVSCMGAICALSLHAMQETQELLLAQRSSYQNNDETLTSDTLEDIAVQKKGFYDLADPLRGMSGSSDERDTCYSKFESCPACVRHMCTRKQLALAAVSNGGCIVLEEALLAAWLAYEEIALGLLCTPHAQLAIIPTGLCFGCAFWCIAFEDSR